VSSQEIRTTWDAGAPFLGVGFYSCRYYQFIVVEKPFRVHHLPEPKAKYNSLFSTSQE
jgi:hypothetical protein